MKIIALLTFFSIIFQAYANESDDTLKFYLSKSSLVVFGTITSNPTAISEEAGVINHYCEFKIQNVLKGNQNLENQVIKINIQRFESKEKDKHPLVKKDSECIVFLKKPIPNAISWVTSDFWFGVQNPSPWMIRSLQKLSSAE